MNNLLQKRSRTWEPRSARDIDEKDDDNACHNCPFNDEACITSGGELVCWQEQTELFTDFIKRIETMVNKIIKEAADD